MLDYNDDDDDDDDNYYDLDIEEGLPINALPELIKQDDKQQKRKDDTQKCIYTLFLSFEPVVKPWFWGGGEREKFVFLKKGGDSAHGSGQAKSCAHMKAIKMA